MEKRNSGFLINKQESEKDYIFGIRAVMESLHAGKEIDKILILKEQKNELTDELIQLAKEHRVPISRVPDGKLNRITRKNHQGVIAYTSAIEYASLDNVVDGCFSKGVAPLILLLDRITDVRNFGAICRTAEVAGVHAVVIPEKGSAQINSDAIKTSAGALNFLPVCRAKNLYYAVKELKKMGLNVVSVTEKTDREMYQADFSAPTLLVMGSEEDGISQDLMSVSDEFVKIPMQGQVDSLNVSVAAGVVIYEALRQRR